MQARLTKQGQLPYDGIRGCQAKNPQHHKDVVDAHLLSRLRPAGEEVRLSSCQAASLLAAVPGEDIQIQQP